MSESQPVISVDTRKVSNGFIVRVTRANTSPAPMVAAEERVFTTWDDYVCFLSAEEFI